MTLIPQNSIVPITTREVFDRLLAMKNEAILLEKVILDGMEGGEDIYYYLSDIETVCEKVAGAIMLKAHEQKLLTWNDTAPQAPQSASEASATPTTNPKG